MSATTWTEDAWAWVRKAPPAAILAIMLILSAWVVYTQDTIHQEQVTAASERDTIRERAKDLDKKLDRANDKLDLILEQQAEMRAAVKAISRSTKG